MGDKTGIEWTEHTFNPWWGCTKVGPGCDHCYAETFDKRVGGAHWGPGAPRRLVKDWSGPRKWNAAALREGRRAWVFCASMADVFDNEVPAEWRARLWDLVRECQQLNWQFVTKRIGNVSKMLPPDWTENFQHCGIIITVVNQEEANRDIPKLLTTPARWRGLSMEPLLGAVDLTNISTMRFPGAEVLNALYGELQGMFGDPCSTRLPGLDWIIIGGESGHHARAFHLRWALDLVRQGEAAGVPVFVKQLGDQPYASTSASTEVPFPAGKKGKDMAEWPPELRVRQMPRVFEAAHA